MYKKLSKKLSLPNNYIEISDDEVAYLDGGADDASSIHSRHLNGATASSQGRFSWKNKQKFYFGFAVFGVLCAMSLAIAGGIMNSKSKINSNTISTDGELDHISKNDPASIMGGNQTGGQW